MRSSDYKRPKVVWVILDVKWCGDENDEHGGEEGIDSLSPYAMDKCNTVIRLVD